MPDRLTAEMPAAASEPVEEDDGDDDTVDGADVVHV